MEPIYFEDYGRYVPNPFAMVPVTAARARQLHRGATPVFEARGLLALELALSEIASGALTAGRKVELLPSGMVAKASRSVSAPYRPKFLGAPMSARAAELPSSSEKVH